MTAAAEAAADRPRAEFAPWIIGAIGLAAMYVPSFIDLALGPWQRGDQMHGPIILAVSIYLFWSLRNAIAGSPFKPRSLSAVLLLCVGLPLYLLGRSQGILIFELGSLMFNLSAVLLLLRGVAALRLSWFPIFFVLFLIPLPGSIVGLLTQPMKLLVSSTTEHLLYAAGYPVSRSGVILYLGQYQLLVADACAGLHTLFSLEALGLFYLQLTKKDSWARNAILAALIVPISLSANTIRVLSLCLITYHFGDEAGQGFIHGFAGVVLFVSALLIIMACDALVQLAQARWVRSGRKPHKPHATASQHSSRTSRRVGEPAQTSSIRTSTVLALSLVTTAALVPFLTPEPIAPNKRPDLNVLIPREFSGWKVDDSIVPVLPNPDQQQTVNETYDQLINRTYFNESGKRMMLSIGYGSRQNDELKAHRQEVCYAAQGFKIDKIRNVTAHVGGVDIPIVQMFAVQGRRLEAVSYWFTVGDQVVTSRMQRLVAQLRYGLSGVIPDGLLVRVSSLGQDDASAYKEQLEFVNDLLNAIPLESRRRFVGSVVS